MFMPAPSLQQKAAFLVGRPVGIALRNGQGVSGVLCSVQGDTLFMMQYLYAAQFATFHYTFSDIADIHAYPSCT